MLLNKLLQLPSPVGNLSIFNQFANSLNQYEITIKDVNELLYIATNTKLYYGGDREFFATHYALYALGALKQVQHCPVLIQYLNRISSDDEWVSSYVSVFEMMGEQATPYLIQACRYVKLEMLSVLIESLARLAVRYPTQRFDVLQAFDDLYFRVQDDLITNEMTYTVESALLLGWIEMQAVERMEMIREIQKYHRLSDYQDSQINALASEHQLKTIQTLLATSSENKYV